MALRLPNHWLWDFWFASDGADVHLFHLQAPRSLGDPERRHRHATIGHAVSRDLRTWEVLEPALGPGPTGAFDDLATWTGCVVPVAGGWRMYYTGISTVDDGARQRVGAARSADLTTWEREGELCAADVRWYEPDDWRDPWVYAADGRLHMLLCARSNDPAVPADGRGVIGHAVSDDDGATWVPQPPLSAPGELRQIEVPQLIPPRDRVQAAQGGSKPISWTVLGCAGAADHSAARLARGAAAEWGMATLRGPGPTGPFTLDDGPFLLGDRAGGHYAARAIEHGGRWWLLAWHWHGPDGAFRGELSDPIPLAIGPDGRLTAEA